MTTIDADPYLWPWDGDLSPNRLAVIVAGAQHYWMDCTLRADEVLGVQAQLLEHARAAGVLVLWIRHGRSATARNSLPVVGSDEWQLVAPVAAGDIVVDASGHDGCYGSPLDALLRAHGRDRMFVCGLGLEGPVHSTLRALNDRGYECLTIADACAPYEPETAAPALLTITMSFGIFGAVASSAAVLAARSQEVAR